MSDSNIGFRPVIRTRERSESQLPPHWSRRATPPQTRPIEKVRSTTMRFLDKITRSSSTLDPDVTRTASCKDKQMMRGKDKQNRLVDRLDAFSQSRGKIRIVRQHVSNRLAYRDVFHSIVEAPLRKIIPGLTLLYLVNCIFFALLWWAASKDCDVGIRNFNNAFIFSTFTIMTIGYGTRDVFFDDCWEASVLIFLESIVSILLDCISLGIVYSHISSGRRRATSILFSDRAVIHRVHGELFFGFQVVEQKKTSARGSTRSVLRRARRDGRLGPARRVPALRDAVGEARRRDGRDAVSLAAVARRAPFGCLVSTGPPRLVGRGLLPP
jgi:hypothetical protein